MRLNWSVALPPSALPCLPRPLLPLLLAQVPAVKRTVERFMFLIKAFLTGGWDEWVGRVGWISGQRPGREQWAQDYGQGGALGVQHAGWTLLPHPLPAAGRPIPSPPALAQRPTRAAPSGWVR